MKQLLIAVSVIAVLVFSGCSRKVDVINMEVYNDAKKFDGVTIQCLDERKQAVAKPPRKDIQIQTHPA